MITAKYVQIAELRLRSRKAKAIQANIDRLDREIDALVYELYSLTEEEIRIVKGG